MLPFQLEPALAVVLGLGSRVLIADEVGLGKTVQAGLIAAEILARTADAHVLVVVPAGLREQWRAELKQRLGIDSVPIDAVMLAGPVAGAAPGSNPWRAAPVVMASIDYVKRPEVLRSLEGLIWDAVVFDEAHALSGRSDRAAAAGALAERARTVVMLSATPHSGDDVAFGRLCGLGDLAAGFPLVTFRRTHQDVGISARRRTTWLRVRRSAAEADLQIALMDYARRVWQRPGANASGAQLAMTVLVRRACSSAASLARSVERRIAMLESENQVWLSPETQTLLPFGETSDDDEPAALLMAAGLEDVDDERRRLRGILQLAQDARIAESKLGLISRLLRRIREPIIVFTEYRDTLAQVGHSLRGLSFVTLHGGLTPTERAESVGRFNEGDVRVLIATDAASEGLNLQSRCRVVVNLELPWTPLRLEQRVGRVDRLGQHRRVHALHLIGDGTSEENTVARLIERFARIKASAAGPHRAAFDEHDVARSVIGREPLPLSDATSDRVVTPHATVPDLRQLARIEAERATTARLLGGSAIGPPPQLRPVMTLLRRRGQVPSCYWAFRLVLEDADSTAQSDIVIGAEHRCVRLLQRTPDNVRLVVASGISNARKAAEREFADIVAILLARLRPSLELATGRELAIMRAIRDHHARIAVRLLQPGLFDHRTERAATAQSSTLNDALIGGATRLRVLERGATMTVASCDLLFAVIVS